jgi:hypothetical protein
MLRSPLSSPLRHPLQSPLAARRGGVPDPALSSPSVTVIDETSADASVVTNTGSGVLYWIASTSATQPTTTQIKAGQMHTGSAATAFGSQAVSESGQQDVFGGVIGLTTGVTYYMHFYQETDSLIGTNIVTSGAFVPADVTGPVLSSAEVLTVGETSATATVNTDTADGVLYWVVTESSTVPSAAQIVAGQNHLGAAAVDDGSASVTASGPQPFALSGLTAATDYWLYIVHLDAAANPSNVATPPGFATNGAAPAGEPLTWLAAITNRQRIDIGHADLYAEVTGSPPATPATDDADRVGTLFDTTTDTYVRADTSARRPTLRRSGGVEWLEFDPTTDFQSIRTVSSFTLQAGWYLSVACRFGVTSGSAFQSVASIYNSTTRMLHLQYRPDIRSVRAISRNSSDPGQTIAESAGAVFSYNSDVVLTAYMGAGTTRVYVGTTQVATNTNNGWDTQTQGVCDIRTGHSNLATTNAFTGRLYSIVAFRKSDGSEISSAELAELVSDMSARF